MAEKIGEQYVGQKKVAMIAGAEEKTPLGGKMFKVTFEDGTEQTFPEKVMAGVVKSEPVDYTTYQKNKVTPVALEVLALFTESDLTIAEVQGCLNLVTASIDDSFNRASNKLWGIEDSGDRSFLKADRILKDGDTGGTA